MAGSIVRTATFLPRAAIPAAIAAELVVLPTPPEPAQMQTRLPSSSSATPGHQSITSGELADLLDAELGLEHERQGPHRRVDQLGEPGELLALRGRRAGVSLSAARQRGAQRAVAVRATTDSRRSASSSEKRSG